MVIDTDDTLAIVHGWPDEKADLRIATWLVERGVSSDRIIVTNWLDMAVAYNRGVRDAALPSRYNEFIFMDKDVIPGPETGPLLTCDADIVGCLCEVENMKSWGDPAVFHTPMWRTSRKVLEAIKPPWFQFGYSPDGCTRTECLCGYFGKKALAKGFTIERAGWVHHKPRNRDTP